MDSRDHGRSGDSPGKITYEKMAVLRKNSVPAEIALPERSCRLCSQYLLSTDVRNYGDVFRSGCRSQSCGGDLG
jgi:hypothetical protein